MLNSFMQFSYDIELIGHTETYHSGFDKGYQANKDPFGRASISNIGSTRGR